MLLTGNAVIQAAYRDHRAIPAFAGDEDVSTDSAPSTAMTAPALQDPGPGKHHRDDHVRHEPTADLSPA